MLIMPSETFIRFNFLKIISLHYELLSREIPNIRRASPFEDVAYSSGRPLSCRGQRINPTWINYNAISPYQARDESGLLHKLTAGFDIIISWSSAENSTCNWYA